MDEADTPTGASVLWMLAHPEVDWGRMMPDLSKQRRSENVEDYRKQPWTLPLYAYRYLGIESTPADILQGLAQGLQHPLTRSLPPSIPPGEQADSPMAYQLGIGDIR